MQPKDFCRQRHWLPPREVSFSPNTSSAAAASNIDALLSFLVDVAIHP